MAGEADQAHGQPGRRSESLGEARSLSVQRSPAAGREHKGSDPLYVRARHVWLCAVPLRTRGLTPLRFAGPSDAPRSLPRPVTYEIAPSRPAAGRSLPPWPDVAAAARVAAGRRGRRLRPRRRGVPRLRDARRRQDHVRPARRAPDAHRGARGAGGGGRADDPHLPPVGAGRGAVRDRAGAEPAERRRAGAARPARRRGHVRDGRGGRGRAPAALRRAADAADRRRAAPHGRGRDVGPLDGRRVRARRGSGCCCRARRSARTTRRSRGWRTTRTASRAPTTATATRRRSSTACAGR